MCEGREDPGKQLDLKIYYSLKKIYGSTTDKLVEKLRYPPSRLYIRVNTMLTARGELIDRLRSRGVEAYPDPYVEEAIYIPLKGPNKIPLLDKVIIANWYAAESIMMGANLYRPGIMRYDEFGKGDLLTVLSPDKQPVAIVEAQVSSHQLKHMRKGLVGENIVSVYKAPPIRDLLEYEEGLFYPQSLPAMMAAKLLSPGRGELIIDMNAAPGGKTSHVVQLTRGAGRVVAFERNVKKSLKVLDTLTRLKLLYNVVIIPWDSRYIDVDFELTGKADKILIDPPCSSLGVRPKLRFDKRYKDVEILRSYQRQFLRVAAKVLGRNGLIVYSTCTLTLEENEENILYAVNDLGLQTVSHGYVPYAEKVYYRGIVAYRFTPLYYDMPGFFIALLRKSDH